VERENVYKSFFSDEMPTGQGAEAKWSDLLIELKKKVSKRMNSKRMNSKLNSKRML